MELGHQAMFQRDNHLMYFKLPVTLKMGVAEYQPAVSQQRSPTTYTTTPLFLFQNLPGPSASFLSGIWMSGARHLCSSQRFAMAISYLYNGCVSVLLILCLIVYPDKERVTQR